MSPTLKKVVAAVAVKKAIDKVQEMRRPKPPVRSRFGKAAIIAAAGGGLVFLAKSGRLRPLLDKVRGRSSGGDSPDRSVRLPESSGPLSSPTPPLSSDSTQQAPAPVH